MNSLIHCLTWGPMKPWRCIENQLSPMDIWGVCAACGQGISIGVGLRNDIIVVQKKEGSLQIVQARIVQSTKSPPCPLGMTRAVARALGLI